MASTSYKPGKWTSGDHAAIFIETPRGVWKAMAHKDDSTVRGLIPTIRSSAAAGRFAVAKKRERAYILAAIPTTSRHRL
jgi:hypothetical protein